jgi:3'(2'), 5'-bisphosphate nucleotidase
MKLNSLWDSLDEQLLPLMREFRSRLESIEISTKVDQTLITEADITVQRVIANTISEAFPDSGFVVEEDMELTRSGAPVWVIDPIDGTREFVNPDSREFCCVVCRLDDGVPTAGYVLAPELAHNRGAIHIRWSDKALVNGMVAEPLPARRVPQRASVTRKSRTAARPFEAVLTAMGCEIKVRTTSQTLDMVRSCLDLTQWTKTSDDWFDVFYRSQQKIWDGAAGIGLATAMGRLAVDGQGKTQTPFSADFLSGSEPILPDTVTGTLDAVRWFIDMLNR